MLFASAIDGINTLTAAKSASRLKAELKPYTNPALLILDELGYLPIDKTGADLLFQHAFRTLFSGSMGGFQSAL